MQSDWDTVRATSSLRSQQVFRSATRRVHFLTQATVSEVSQRELRCADPDIFSHSSPLLQRESFSLRSH